MNSTNISVVYYTHTYFLDATIETLKSFKDKVDIHLLIELAPESKNSTILDIDSLDGFAAIERVENVLDNKMFNLLKNYFSQLASVHFVIHTSKGGFSFSSFTIASKVGKWINTLNPDIIHFDTISSRTIGIYPYIRNKKIFITIHDPVAHSGEYSWKRRIPKFVYFSSTIGFFFYSSFAKSQFQIHYPNIDIPKHVLKLQPYSFIKNFTTLNIKFKNNSFILFFGRISYYKGIDILLASIPNILEKFPNENFVIAGNFLQYPIDNDFLEKYGSHITIINEYVSIDTLSDLIQSCKFVVCPYRDATQSGVLMTTMALGKSTIASNVGSFPEYINDGVNGLLTEPTISSLTNTIIKALENNRYLDLERNLKSDYSFINSNYNQQKIISAYTRCDTKFNAINRLKRAK